MSAFSPLSQESSTRLFLSPSPHLAKGSASLCAASPRPAEGSGPAGRLHTDRAAEPPRVAVWNPCGETLKSVTQRQLGPSPRRYLLKVKPLRPQGPAAPRSADFPFRPAAPPFRSAQILFRFPAPDSTTPAALRSSIARYLSYASALSPGDPVPLQGGHPRPRSPRCWPGARVVSEPLRAGSYLPNFATQGRGWCPEAPKSCAVSGSCVNVERVKEKDQFRRISKREGRGSYLGCAFLHMSSVLLSGEKAFLCFLFLPDSICTACNSVIVTLNKLKIICQSEVRWKAAEKVLRSLEEGEQVWQLVKIHGR